MELYCKSAFVPSSLSFFSSVTGLSCHDHGPADRSIVHVAGCAHFIQSGPDGFGAHRLFPVFLPHKECDSKHRLHNQSDLSKWGDRDAGEEPVQHRIRLNPSGVSQTLAWAHMHPRGQVSYFLWASGSPLCKRYATLIHHSEIHKALPHLWQNYPLPVCWQEVINNMVWLFMHFAAEMVIHLWLPFNSTYPGLGGFFQSYHPPKGLFHSLFVGFFFFFFFFPATLCGLCDLISLPTRDRTRAPCSGSPES